MDRLIRMVIRQGGHVLLDHKEKDYSPTKDYRKEVEQLEKQGLVVWRYYE
jgi:hypothetical protein